MSKTKQVEVCIVSDVLSLEKRLNNGWEILDAYYEGKDTNARRWVLQREVATIGVDMGIDLKRFTNAELTLIYHTIDDFCTSAETLKPRILKKINDWI